MKYLPAIVCLAIAAGSVVLSAESSADAWGTSICAVGALMWGFAGGAMFSEAIDEKYPAAF